MASFDSPVYEPGEEGHTSYQIIDNNLHNMDSETREPGSPRHSDASTIEKRPDDIQDDDDDEHDYTYPDGVSGGTFDAPAPSSALIVAPKSEEVMMTEVVIPDNRMSSIPDYYKPRSSSKPYKFYSKFHSAYVVCKIIGFVFLALVTIATCAVLILRVSIDHSFFDDEESTTAPMEEITSRFTSSISVLGVDGMAIMFTPALNDSESVEYNEVAMAVTSSMDAVYSTGPLSSSYQGSEVSAIREGSVIVDVILTFTSTNVITSNEVEVAIMNELDRNSNVLSDIMVDPASVLVSDYNKSPAPSLPPTVKPGDGSTVPQTTRKDDVTASNVPSTTEKPSESPVVTDNKETTESPDSTTQNYKSTEKTEQPSEAPLSTTKPDVTTDKIEQSTTTKQEVSTVIEKMEQSTGPPLSTTPGDSTTLEKMEQSTRAPLSTTKLGDSTTLEKMEQSTRAPLSTTKLGDSTTLEKMEQSTRAPLSTTKTGDSTTLEKMEQSTRAPLSTTKLGDSTTLEKMEQSTRAPLSTTKLGDSTTVEKMEQSTRAPLSTTKLGDSTTVEKMEQSTRAPLSTTKVGDSTTLEKMEQSTRAPLSTTNPEDSTTPEKMEQSTTPQTSPTKSQYITTKLDEYSSSMKPSMEPSTPKSMETSPEKLTPTTETMATGDHIPPYTTPPDKEETPTPMSAAGGESSCAQQRDFLVSFCENMNETCPWIYSCLSDGSWNPVQCSQVFGDCFCVDDEGRYIPGSTVFEGEPNCTSSTLSSLTSSPIPTGRRKKRQVIYFEQAQPTCSFLEVRCKNGGCVHFSVIGDGNNDCGDNSDEKFNNCTANPFLCDETMCVHPDFVCDGEEDCMNGKDEDDCIEEM